MKLVATLCNKADHGSDQSLKYPNFNRLALVLVLHSSLSSFIKSIKRNPMPLSKLIKSLSI